MHMTVSIRLDDGQVVSARQEIPHLLSPGLLRLTAKNLTSDVVEEAVAVLAEGE